MNIISGIATAIVALVLPFTFSSSAEASVEDRSTVVETSRAGDCNFFCFRGYLQHHSPDAGYDPPILFACNKNSTGWRKLYEGEATDKYCTDSDGIGDFDKYKLRAKEKLVCWTLFGGWDTEAVGPTVKYVSNTFNGDCALKLK